MSVFLGVVATLAVLLVLLGIWLPMTAPDPVKARLSQFAERTRSLDEIELEQPFTDRVLRPLILQVARLMTRFIPRRKRGSLDSGFGGIQKRLALAGNPHNMGANDFLGVLGVSVVSIGGLVFVLMGLAGADVVTAALLGLVGAGIGYYVPTVWLSSRIKARQKEIQKAMPDSLDLLVISVEAGLGFDAAVQRLTEKADHALAREFRRMLAEIKMGRARREALRDLVGRTEVPDLNTFASAIIQADQLGVSVSRVLAVQSEQIRLLRRQRAEEAAAKAPLKMLFPMVLLIFPSMFVVILGPSIPSLLGGGGL
jgi:tight adherence protein C